MAGKQGSRKKHEEPLTDLKIKALKAEAKRRSVHDFGRPGLWIEIFPSGTKVWRFRYHLNGKPEKVTIGKYPQVSLGAARQKRDELAVMVAKGESPACKKQESKVARASETSMQVFAERYFDDVAKKNVEDTGIIRRYLDKEIYPAFGTKSLKDISLEDVQSLVLRKRDNGFPSAAVGIKNLLKRIFEYAIFLRVANNNPALLFPTKFIGTAQARKRNLTKDEITAYLQTLYRSNIRRQFKLGLHIILLTLIRKSELILAEWNEVDFEASEWNVPAEHCKGKENGHLVFLSRQVEEMFKELKYLAGNSRLVMPGRGSISKPFAKNALNKALEGVNFPIPPFTIHDMRRTASTLLNEQGFSSDVIEKALNHTIGGVRGVYNRAEYAEPRKQMLQSWADYVEKLQNGCAQ